MGIMQKTMFVIHVKTLVPLAVEEHRLIVFHAQNLDIYIRVLV